MRKNSSKMTVEEIRNLWHKQWNSQEVRQHGMYQFPEVCYTIRDSNRKWNTAEIETFSKHLGEEDEKWFVANLFSIQETIPESLFEPLLNAAISEPDPSFNEEYITPCLRVFGFERVFGFLDASFVNGNNETKMGVCKAYYWARSPLIKSISGNKSPKIKGYFQKWNGYYYGNYHWETRHFFEMTESEVADCSIIAQNLLTTRQKILLEEFINNNDQNVRKSIKLALPNHLSFFFEPNRDLAKVYFKKLRKIKWLGLIGM